MTVRPVGAGLSESRRKSSRNCTGVQSTNCTRRLSNHASSAAASSRNSSGTIINACPESSCTNC